MRQVTSIGHCIRFQINVCWVCFHGGKLCRFVERAARKFVKKILLELISREGAHGILLGFSGGLLRGNNSFVIPDT